MRVVTLFLFTLFSYSMNAQETYYHEFDLFPIGYNWMNSLHVDEEDIYVGGDVLCIDGIDTTNCFGVINLTDNLDLKWIKQFPDFRPARFDAITTVDNHIYVCGNENTNLHVVKMNLDGNTVSSFSKNMELLVDNKPLSFYSSRGITIFEERILTWGQFDKSDDEEYGYFQFLDKDFNQDTTHYFAYPEAERLLGNYKLQINNSGNIVTSNRIYEPIPPIGISTILIREFDSDLNIISNSFGPQYGQSNSISPYFTIVDDQHYAFLYRVESIFHESAPLLVYLSQDSNIIWEYDFFKEFGLDYTDSVVVDISLSEIITSSDGSIIGGGFITRYVNNELFYDGFLYKISNQGKLIWQNQFTKLNDDGSPHSLVIRELSEMQDGRILALGTRRHTSSSFLLMVDGQTGCVEGYPCDGDILLQTANSEEDYPLTLYPNPATNAIQIETNHPWSHYSVSTIMGATVLSNQWQRNEAISLTSLPNGIYLITFTDNLGNQAVEKFVKR